MIRWHQRLGLAIMLWGLGIQMTIPNVAHPHEAVLVAAFVLGIGGVLLASPERKRS